MVWQYSPYAIIHVGITVVVAALGAVAYRHRDTPGVAPLVWLTSLSSVWVGLAAGRMFSADLFYSRLFDSLTYLPIALVPVAFLYFAEEYTGNRTVLTRYGPVPLLVVPALTQVIAWTNGVHDLMWAGRELVQVGGYAALSLDFGPWFWVHSGYSYLLLFVGSFLLVRMLLIADHHYRGQTAAIALGIFIPWAVNAAYISGYYRPPFDPTPAAFAASAALFLVAIYRHKLLELVPVAREVARDELMDNLAEAVLIVDDRRTVIDCNAHASDIAGIDRDEIIGRDLSATLPALDDVAEAAADASDGRYETEIALRNDDLRYYDVRISDLHRGGGLLRGHLVSLRDVTERRQREQRLDVLNRTLRHDLRNEANVILGYAELGKREHPDAEWVDAIKEHVEGLVELSVTVRQLEQALDGENVESTVVDVSAMVERVIDEVTADRPTVDIETDLEPGAYASAIELVDAAVTNAVENAIEHNDNPDTFVEVSVSVRETADDEIVVEIADNGPGIPKSERAVLLRGRETQLDHVSGLGLWLINWIVTESGGTIAFDENDRGGSVVTLRLPAVDGSPEDAVKSPVEDLDIGIDFRRQSSARRDPS
ncbi:histidine kinase N-terminal 7TM domain-containing protein [Halorientalis litorea]|uniref:histidine kinase N-terminal 7TM domain-containing protein n=1 Tax=Halorientalis litorea TaxID=2931977 RepID=UPI001FF6A84B|nr:histidine kinase N-terminal 7TM domain-containing protein [Halorientalis litorea]